MTKMTLNLTCQRQGNNQFFPLQFVIFFSFILVHEERIKVMNFLQIIFSFALNNRKAAAIRVKMRKLFAISFGMCASMELGRN